MISAVENFMGLEIENCTKVSIEYMATFPVVQFAQKTFKKLNIFANMFAETLELIACVKSHKNFFCFYSIFFSMAKKIFLNLKKLYAKSKKLKVA
jgi:hypothetical protein